MCILTSYFGRSGSLTPPPWNQDPRSLPRSTWAVPLDPIDLVSSMEAYANTIATFNLVRICHRFGNSALSRLPHELLELILTGIYEEEKSTKKQQWTAIRSCFVDDCKFEEHLVPGELDVEALWNYYCEGDPGIAASEWTPEELVEELKSALATSTREGDMAVWYEALMTNDCCVHRRHKSTWLKRMCLCNSKAKGSHGATTFFPFNALLKSHFGLEAVILHEFVEREKVNPYNVVPHEWWYTHCYLIPAAPVFKPKRDTNGIPIPPPPNLKAPPFEKVFDPCSEDIQARFPRAMRILGLKPLHDAPEHVDDESEQVQGVGKQPVPRIMKLPTARIIPHKYSIYERGQV